MDYANNQQPNRPNVYGMLETDYPSSNALGVSIFPQTRQQAFPQELEDQFKQMQSNFSTGLFPSVSLAWMTIDSDLFLWNFETNTDLAYLDRISNTILLVELCKPRPSFDTADTQFFLVVATTVEILLMTLTFQDEYGVTRPIAETCFKSSAAFIDDPIYKLPLEGLIVSSIRCTDNGRIFFSADDCCYELEYYDKTWFSGHTCKKINHSRGLLSSLVPVLNIFGSKDEVRQLEIDSSRHLLYILFKRGNVQIFDLGVDGKATQKFYTYQREQLEHDATALCNVNTDYFREVISVSAIPATTSHTVYFILTTAKGVRIYFSCLMSNALPNANLTQTNARPQTVRITQIRFPNSEQSFSLKGVSVYSSVIDRDTCLMASELGNPDQSNFWVFTSSNFVESSRNDEHSVVFPIHGAVWTISKAAEQSLRAAVKDTSVLPREEKPLIERQHYCRAEKFFVLTSKGVLTFAHLAPVEIFRKILAKYGSESNEFQALASILPRQEICVMSIIVLCSDNPADVGIKDSALRTFFVFGGEPTMTMINGSDYEYRSPSSAARNGRPPSAISGWHTPVAVNGATDSPKTPFQSPRFSGPLKTSTPHDSHTPNVRNQTFNGLADETVAGSPVIAYSARHEALRLYFDRILAPVLGRKLCYVEKNQYVSSFSLALLDHITRFLASYKQTIEEYSLISASHTSHYAHARQHISDPRDTSCKEQEKISLSNLRNDIDLTLEILGLWSVLLEFRREDFHTIITALPAALQQELMNWEFEDLFKNREQSIFTGKSTFQTCVELITCIVRFYIGDDASTTAISKRLREICPSIFTVDDAQVVKATENLYRVKTAANSKERTQLIDEAIITLQQSISKLNLVQLCDLLIQIGHFEGIVDLALAKADNDDKSQLALIAYKRQINETQADAVELSEANRKRVDAYTCITETLQLLHVVAQSNSKGAVTLNSSTYLFPSAESVKELSPATAKAERDQMIRRVFASDDELANVAVFRWLLQHKMANVLLEQNCRFFEAFLLHEIEQSKDNTYLDLLWKYNEKTGRYAEAAKILYQMAKKVGSCRIALYQRIAYLSQALICIQTDTESKTNTELKTEIEDTMEVMQLQLKAKTTLESDARVTQTFGQRQLSEAAASLNYNLFTLTELYQQFAVVYYLYEIQLLILHCAGHDEVEAIETVWTAILQRELAQFTMDGEEKTKTTIGNLLQKMRKHFIRSLQYVPQSFILKVLLTEGLKKLVSATWLPDICSIADIPYNLLLDVADHESRIGDKFWRQNPRAQQFIVDLFVVVCQRFKADHQRLSLNEKSVLRDACLNGLAQLILEAHNRNKRSSNLEVLQAEIERIV